MTDERWPKPKATGNAYLLLGFIGGRIHNDYSLEERAADGLIVKNRTTGNRFKIHVDQISGTE
jgi:hypothetical protein